MARDATLRRLNSESPGGNVFDPDLNLLEIVARVAIVYLALLALLRIAGKRQLGQLSPMDLLTMLLVSETVSPALTAGDTSVPTGLVAGVTLILFALAISWLTFKSRTVERLTEGKPTVLITDGKLDQRVMASERITAQELTTALHRQGLSAISQVALGTVEPDGEITMVKQ